MIPIDDRKIIQVVRSETYMDLCAQVKGNEMMFVRTYINRRRLQPEWSEFKETVFETLE